MDTRSALGHTADGYPLYSLGIRRWGRLSDRTGVFLMTVGTQFPVPVDKPLAWEFGVLESGRTFGHSVLIAVVVNALLHRFDASWVDQSRVAAFVLGYLSHPLAE